MARCSPRWHPVHGVQVMDPGLKAWCPIREAVPPTLEDWLPNIEPRLPGNGSSPLAARQAEPPDHLPRRETRHGGGVEGTGRILPQEHPNLRVPLKTKRNLSKLVSVVGAGGNPNGIALAPRPQANCSGPPASRQGLQVLFDVGFAVPVVERLALS